MTNSFPVGRLRPPPDAPVDPARLRAVHRAVSELRRGTPILLTGELPGAEPLALLAVETVGPRGVGAAAAFVPACPGRGDRRGRQPGRSREATCARRPDHGSAGAQAADR